MIDYSGHNDHMPNADMDSIIAAHPDILIDNTPGGYWNGQCLPSVYAPHGIKVYSYITGGREGTEYGTSEDDSAANIARIDAIALDGAYGVFFDEVSTYPNSAGKGYLLAMINEAHAKGLKIILNPGTYTFDTFLINRSDFVMTDEHYTTRSMSASEAVNPAKVIVVNEGVTTAFAAAAVTDSARSKGYAYSYACADYMIIPTWINAYMSLVTFVTATPTITLSGGIFYSSTAYGNQWYSTASGAVAGATAQTFVPSTPGLYYDIVTQSGCQSGISDTLAFYPMDVAFTANTCNYRVYPYPANDQLFIDNAKATTITVYNIIGKVLLSRKLSTNNEKISLSELNPGIYLAEITGSSKTIIKFAKE